MLIRQLSELFRSPLKFIQTGLWSTTLQQVGPAVSLCSVRWASKKSGSSKRNHGGKSKGKRLGVKKREGSYVQPGMTLVKQKMAFRWYPGSFVVTGRDRTLTAQVAGHVYFTRERWHPRPDTAFGKSIAPTLSDEEMTRTFVNIRPELEVGRFKLKEQI
ncbi:39S ribosomal protein L27, mitochondrial-like [Acanthaster planci]|uniref:Large ribosomal subunit protein bL27m n=1 Tax=Acanthaster planci TaxID=133434 RepID=A0A8B7YAF8_ACAPL|nr:39S ribosomal protein L27, mitochondrial-like [Acanthaster planci]